MTHPLTPREKVARILFERGRGAHDAASWTQAGSEMQEWLLGHADAILTALASGSGDHADHSGEATNMVDHAELCERLRDTYIRFNMGHREAPLRNPDGPLAAEALEALLAENAALRAKSDPSNWKDREDQWSKAVEEAHPVNSIDPDRHKHFDTAMSMVGNRHGKYELVGLVHWLLTRATEAERKLAEAVAVIERLASSEAFDIPRAIDGPLAAEVRARMDYARNYISKEAERG